jgi:hypothetical protein
MQKFVQKFRALTSFNRGLLVCGIAGLSVSGYGLLSGDGYLAFMGAVIVLVAYVTRDE